MPTLFATCAPGLEPLLVEELRAVGATRVRSARAGVAFEGDLRVAYAACLWSRVASRVLLPLAKVPAGDADALYEGVAAIPWEEHLSPDGTLAVDFATDANPAFRNTMFGALKVKDAVVDRLRDRFGRRPSVDAATPDVRINARVRAGVASISIDLAGDALHRRGYREPGVQGAAPLKESLAAAMLLLAGWPRIAAAGGSFVDPMCGSGTLLVEAAWIAGDRAPGLMRAHWGFEGWLGHDAAAWESLLAEADDRAEAGQARLGVIAGSDVDAAAVTLARETVARAGLRGAVELTVADVADAAPPADAPPGLVAVNPPYGERLADREQATGLYRALGGRLRQVFPDWEWAVLAGWDEHVTALGLLPAATHRLRNGALEVRLDVGSVPGANPDVTGGAEAFANRVRKNARHLGKWARREQVRAWRVYDADLPDYALALDLYDCEDGVRRAVAYEYEAPRGIDPARAALRLASAVEAIPEALGVDASEVRVKVRRRQRGEAQYERHAATGRMHEVREGDAVLLVNLDDYLDTGLFLDHRITRRLVADLAVGARLLNLFCYTATATVVAALAGAAASDSVDLSNTYTDWARRNLERNGVTSGSHRVVRADVLRWLEEAGASEDRWDVVFCDPPSFSTSAAMEGTLDIQRDHVDLLRACERVLAPGGTIVFSTNLRRFRLYEDALKQAGMRAEDVSAATVPPDFARNPRIHRCFTVRRG